MTKFTNFSEIQYSEQVDYLLLWIETAPFKIKNEILEAILVNSNLNQITLLWTILQPVSHRDFYYSGQFDYPGYSFAKLSTPVTRLFKRHSISKDDSCIVTKTFSEFKKSKNTRLGNFTRRLGTALTTRSQQSDNVNLTTSYYESQYILMEHYKRRKRETSAVFKQREDVYKINEKYINEKSAIEEKNKLTKKNVLLHSKSMILKDKNYQKNLEVAFNEQIEQVPKSPTVRSYIKSSLTKDTSGTVNNKKWLPDLEVLPHVIRFPKLPVRRHIQENSYLETPYPSNSSKTIVSLTAREQQEKEHELIERVKLKADLEIEEPLQSAFYKNSIQNLLTSFNNNKIEIKKEMPKEMKHHLELFMFWYSEIWSDNERSNFLRQLLLKLDARHHYFMFTYLSIRQYRDFISCLPDDIAIKILSYLTPRELVIVSKVCKKWKKITESSKLWESKCRDIMVELPASYAYGNPEWRKIFQQNEELKKNWNNGKCRIVQCKGHTNDVLCVTIDEKLMATGSMDRTIKVWFLKDGRLLQTLVGHKKGVWCVRFITKFLLCSGSHDTTLKIWNLKQGTCTRTLYSHTGPIWALAQQDNILVSASQDKTAKVWDISGCNLIFSLTSHKEAVFCADIQKNTIVTGSGDKTIKLWNLFDGVCFKTIYVNDSVSVMSVSLDKQFVACSCNQTILVWKIEQTLNGYTAKKIREYKEHYKRIESIKIRMTDPAKEEGLMASGGQDGLIKYWRLDRDKSFHTFDVHNGKRINCVFFDELRIASASSDHYIKLLNFSSDIYNNDY